LTAIILAAGESSRVGIKKSKALLPLAGQPVLAHVLEMWKNIATEMVVAVRPQDRRAATVVLAPYGAAARLVEGGEYRAESTALVLSSLNIENSSQLIAIHDAARPLTAENDIRRVIEAAKREGAAILAAPLNDTIRYHVEGKCGVVIPRSDLLAAQTPQVFRADWLFSAYAAANEAKLKDATDDATLVIEAGYSCSFVWAESANLKLTYREDFLLAEEIINKRLALHT